MRGTRATLAIAALLLPTAAIAGDGAGTAVLGQSLHFDEPLALGARHFEVDSRELTGWRLGGDWYLARPADGDRRKAGLVWQRERSRLTIDHHALRFEYRL